MSLVNWPQASEAHHSNISNVKDRKEVDWTVTSLAGPISPLVDIFSFLVIHVGPNTQKIKVLDHSPPEVGYT